MSNLAKKTDDKIIPAYLKHEGPAQGTEGMGREDYTLPRVALCQSNTPQRKSADPGFIPGLEEGMFFNTVTQEIYGTSFVAVPLFFFKQRMYFKPMSEGGGMLCQSLNAIDGGRLHPQGCATCPHSAFKNEGSDTRPDCNMMADYMLLMPGNSPAVLTMKSTGLKAARQLNAAVRLSGLDMFARHLHVKAVSAVKQGNQFWMPVLAWKDFVPEVVYKAAQTYFAELSKEGIQVDTRGMESDVDPAEPDVDGAPTTDKNIPF